MKQTARVFYQEDCDLSLLYGKTIAVIGYGSQGHAHALNAKESLGDKARLSLVCMKAASPGQRLKQQGFEVLYSRRSCKAGRHHHDPDQR